MSELTRKLDLLAVDEQKTTFSSFDPTTGGTLVWVTHHEMDPLSALLSAAVSIMIRTGSSGKWPVTVRKTGIDDNFFWQVEDGSGNVLSSGYAETEEEANLCVANAITTLTMPKE